MPTRSCASAFPPPWQALEQKDKKKAKPAAKGRDGKRPSDAAATATPATSPEPELSSDSDISEGEDTDYSEEERLEAERRRQWLEGQEGGGGEDEIPSLNDALQYAASALGMTTEVCRGCGAPAWPRPCAAVPRPPSLAQATPVSEQHWALVPSLSGHLPLLGQRGGGGGYRWLRQRR